MCGILGLVGDHPVERRERFRASLERLRHRGPDGEAAYTDGNVILGMRRLAIIDLKTGDQPLFDESGEIAAVGNGEIYNFIELRDRLERTGHRFRSMTDLAVVPHLIEEGDEFASQLWGMFALAVHDKRRRRVLLVRDRLGVKPLYVYSNGRAFAFASELGALRHLMGRDAMPLRAEAIVDYLQYGFVREPWTMFQDCKALEPGTVLEIDTASFATRAWKYWNDETQNGNQVRDTAEALEAVEAVLADATRIRLRSDVPLGLFLSGGIDSGLIAAFAARAAGRVRCFTVASDDQTYDESEAAALTARTLGLQLEIVPSVLANASAVEEVARAYGQPFGDPSAVPSLAVARAAKQHVSVVLNGDGGDEMFGGYRRHWYGLAMEHPMAILALRASSKLLNPHLLSGVGRRTAVGFFSRVARAAGASSFGESYRILSSDLVSFTEGAQLFPDLFGTQNYLDDVGEATSGAVAEGFSKLLQTDRRIGLRSDMLVKADIASMRSGVEARSPFLDHRVCELVSSLSPSVLMSTRRTKPLLRRLAQRMLPAEIASAPKRGFELPLERWLAGALRQDVRHAFLSGSSTLLRFSSPARLASILGPRQNFAGDRTRILWALLVLERWLALDDAGEL